MLFAIDIDGTIAYDKHNAARKQFVARALSLPSDESAARKTLASIPQEHIKKTIDEVYRTPEVMSSLTPIPGALAAVTWLSRQGNVLYVSCRVASLYDTTTAWLTRHGFPHPENVRLCDSYHAKYEHADEFASGDSILLIDDRAESVVRAFQQIALHQPARALSLVPRLTVAAFHPKEQKWSMSAPPFPVLVLPGWGDRVYLEKLVRKVGVPARV